VQEPLNNYCVCCKALKALPRRLCVPNGQTKIQTITLRFFWATELFRDENSSAAQQRYKKIPSYHERPCCSVIVLPDVVLEHIVFNFQKATSMKNAREACPQTSRKQITHCLRLENTG
jgi:hypothetical protein